MSARRREGLTAKSLRITKIWPAPGSSGALLAFRPVRAAVCHELGPPSVLRVEERPDPEPGPGEVAVAVEAAGVNFVDGLFVAGQYQIKPSLPFVPGSEVAGHVVAVGPDVRSARDRRPGAGLGRSGWLRQPRRGGSRVGDPAARGHGRAPGRHLHPELQHDASSHCATVATQRPARPCSSWAPAVASGWPPSAWRGRWAAGCSAVASTADKRQAALGGWRRSGAGPGGRVHSRRRRAPGPAAPVSTSSWTPSAGRWPSRRYARSGDRGRYLVIGFASGDIPAVPLNQILLRNRSVIGIDWGIWAMTHPTEQRALLGDLLAMVAAGTLDPVRPTEYPLDNVAGALEDLLGRRTVGKIALVP